jgi:hypothetical protein
MERLTVKWADKVYDTFDPVDVVDNEYSKANYNKILTKLGDYEDLDEQGRLLKLPCKVGDMLYYPDKEFNIIIPMRLTKIVIKFNGLDTSSCQYDCCSFDECGDAYEDYEFDDEDIGETVFLEKTKAEAKLKELQGKVSRF